MTSPRIVKLERAQHPESTNQGPAISSWGHAKMFAFPTGSQRTLMLLVEGLRFESHHTEQQADQLLTPSQTNFILKNQGICNTHTHTHRGRA